MLKSKLEFKIQVESPTVRDYFKKYWFYGVSLGRTHYNQTNLPDRDIYTDMIYDRKANKKWINITASKNQGMGSIFLLFASLGYKVGDICNEYNKALFLPNYQSMGYFNSLQGVKLPIGSQYPTLIDFDTTSFISTLLAYKKRAYKTKNKFISLYKLNIIKSTSTVIANYLTRQDKLYLNPIDFNFYNIKDNSLYTGYVPDEYIFRPFNTGDIQKTKQQVLREWTDFKYFGSNLMLPKFIPNEEKKQKYLKSLVKENEELIEIEQLDYKKSNKDSLARLILQETLGDYYDGNDNLTFTFNGNIYSIDIENEQFLDSNGNVIPYIAKYDTNNSLESILSFKEYKSIIKETFTDDDALIQQKTIDKIKDNTISSNIDLVKWKDEGQFYLDNTKDNRLLLFFGNRIIIQYHEYEFLGSDDGNPIYGLGNLKTITKTFNQLKSERQKEEGYIISGYQAALHQAYDLLVGDELNKTINTNGNIYRYNNIGSEGGEGTGWYVVAITPITIIANRTLYNLENVYEYDDKSISLQIDTNKNLVKTYTNRDIILSLFDYTQISNLDTSKANYDSIYTYFKELNYTEGEVWDIVDIQPIFSISGVVNNFNCYLNTSNITANKILDKEGEYTDNDGNKYNIKQVGMIYNPPQTFEKQIINDDGSVSYETVEITESQIPKQEVKEITIQDLVRFTLPRRQLKIYSKVSNYIKQLKNNQINGYLIRYKDLTDNKIKVKLYNESAISFANNTCDLSTNIVKCLPLVPFWTHMVTLDAIQAGIIDMWNPSSWTSAAGKKKGVINNNFLGYFNSSPNIQGFYQFYDKKINKYYKDSLNFYLKEWEQQINGEFNDDEYNVKMKKLSNRFKNKESIVYSESVFKKPEDKVSDYDSYRNSATSFGYHTAIRFSFAIYFNKHFRKTKLISRIGFQYLDYFYKMLNGQYGQWIEQYIYPPDRVQFAEKRILLRFKKEKYNKEVEGNKSSHYCDFLNREGFFVFYNKTKQEKFTLDINTYIPNWRSIYFDGINTYQYINELLKLNAKDRLGLYQIIKDDIQSFNKTIDLSSKNKILLNSIFYNTPINVGNKKFNIWDRVSNTDYSCFYTPHSSDIDSYKFTQEESFNIINNFSPTNIYDYLFNKLAYRPIVELKEIYLKIFNKDIEVLPIDSNNMFNYSGVFNDLVISTVDEELFKFNNEPQTSSVYAFDELPYQNNTNLSREGIALTQAYYLNLEYDKSVLIFNEINDENKKQTNIVANEIIYYLLDNELPKTKYVTPKEFKDYFISYDVNGALASIFTNYEIYQIGFKNFLVTNDVEQNELTILLEKIDSISKRFITNMDIKAGNITYHSCWLPVPVDVYKRLPIYSKNLLGSLFLNIEFYSVTVIPSINETSAIANRSYQYGQITFAIALTIVSIVANVITFGSSTPATAGAVAFTIISIIGAAISLIGMIIQLVALALPSNIAKKLMLASQILSYIGAIFSMVGSFGGGANLNTMQICNIAINSINYSLAIADKIIEVIYTKKQLAKNKEYNEAVDRYNQSQDELIKFIEDYEFEAELLDRFQPININAKERSLFDDHYDESIEMYVENSLTLLYENIDDYYDNRL